MDELKKAPVMGAQQYTGFLTGFGNRQEKIHQFV
jgi:hypothetical protein